MDLYRIIINDYSVDIVTKQGKIRPTNKFGHKYYSLQNGQQYAIKLTNQNPTRCDAHVSISGKKVGVYRISPNSSTIVNSPLKSSEQFIFNKKNSFTNKWSTIECNTADKGLIRVLFKPEAGSYGNNCIQEHDNHCSNIKTVITGPKGEINTNNVNYDYPYCPPKNCDDSWSAQMGNGELAQSGLKVVPVLKDIDAVRTTSMQARLVLL
jgi:hypothetical protein